MGPGEDPISLTMFTRINCSYLIEQCLDSLQAALPAMVITGWRFALSDVFEGHGVEVGWLGVDFAEGHAGKVGWGGMHGLQCTFLCTSNTVHAARDSRTAIACWMPRQGLISSK